MTNITIHDLKERLNKKEKINLFDVREEWEAEQFNIGADLIPLSAIMTKLNDLEHLKEEEVVIHCQSGARSVQACMILEQMGFKNVVNVIGGMNEWKAAFGDTALT